MKKGILLIVLVLFPFIFLSNFDVYASSSTVQTSSTDTDSALKNAEISPTSPFYGFYRFFENLSLFLTFNQTNKAEKLTEFAQERLSELNTLNPTKDIVWIDKLYNDYGVELSEADTIVDNLLVKGSDNSKVIALQNKIEDATSNEQLLKPDIQSEISSEMSGAVQQVKINSYLSSISSSVSRSDLALLKKENCSNGTIVKLKALSNLSGLSISDILSLDIYMPDDPASPKVEKNIDFSKLETMLGMNNSQMMSELKAYHKTLVDEQNANTDHGDGNSNAKKQAAIDARNAIINQIQANIHKNSGHANSNGSSNNGTTGNSGTNSGDNGNSSRDSGKRTGSNYERSNNNSY